MEDKEVLARTLPPPVDVAVDGNFAGKLTPNLRHELLGWVILPLAALALAGLLALMLAFARVPGADNYLFWATQTFFEKGLVAHVTFAFVIWYLGVQGALTVLVTAQTVSEDGNDVGGLGLLAGRVGVYGAALSLPLLLVPVLADLGVTSPNNYIPVIIHPLYYAGLTLLGVSLTLPILRLLLLLVRRRTVEAATFGVACAGLIYLIALVCFGAAWLTRPEGLDPAAVTEYVMWGGGHILQFANTALMFCALYLLTRVTLGETPLPPVWFKVMMALLLAGGAAGPLLYLTYVGGDPAQRMIFTELYWYALPIPSTVIILGLVALLVRRRADLRAGAPELTGLTVALVLFAAGGLMGFFESSSDTRTPAHYHAVLIAVTLAFMALYFALLLPLLGRRTERRKLRTAMYLLLGGGQLLHSIGLFGAGFLGVARKTAGSEQGLDSASKIAAMSVMGLGGLIAVIGGIIFIVLAGKLVLAKRGPGDTANPVGTLSAH